MRISIEIIEDYIKIVNDSGYFLWIDEDDISIFRIDPNSSLITKDIKDIFNLSFRFWEGNK